MEKKTGLLKENVRDRSPATFKNRKRTRSKWMQYLLTVRYSKNVNGWLKNLATPNAGTLLPLTGR